MDSTDKILLELITEKDQKAYNELYRRYRRVFYDLAFSYTRDKDVSDEMEIQEVMELLDKTIADMLELTREIFVHRWKEGYSTAETAKQLSISEQTVRSRYNWALESVRKQIKPLYTSKAYF